MTCAEQYAEHTEGLEHISTGIIPECPVCQADYDRTAEQLQEDLDSGELAIEPSVSSAGCDFCGSTEQQNVYDAHALVAETGEMIHLQACEDCARHIDGTD